ncbi:helix-turn-helix domain-containing protein [Kitasatospora sp. NPDC056076]|uniref:helix-turn-helix domain-containing protein n=1 Tax=Kitasatospora sp. NPDC056076 TaxID=3345703 RepID=UPI0035D78761
MPNKRAIPTARRRRLGKELRKYRNEAKLSLDHMAGLMGAKWDGPKVSRIENATARIHGLDTTRFLAHCGVTDPEIVTEMEILARNAGKTGWWSTYDGIVPKPLEVLIDAEEEALVMRHYYATVLPGLLQTGAYAREITTATATRIPKERHPGIVDVRMGRQAVLTRPNNPPECMFVIHEALLMQKFTPHPTVMREQLLRLIDVSELPHVNLQVMPLDAGPHPGAEGNLSILKYPRPWPTLVSIEAGGESRQLEGSDAESERFLKNFELIMAAALPADRSRDLIRHHMKGLK